MSSQMLRRVRKLEDTFLGRFEERYAAALVRHDPESRRLAEAVDARVYELTGERVTPENAARLSERIQHPDMLAQLEEPVRAYMCYLSRQVVGRDDDDALGIMLWVIDRHHGRG